MLKLSEVFLSGNRLRKSNGKIIKFGSAKKRRNWERVAQAYKHGWRGPKKESLLLLLKKRVEYLGRYNEEIKMKLSEKILKIKDLLKPRPLTNEELELCKRLGKDNYTALEEAFQSLSDLLCTAIRDSFGPGCYIVDFSQDEVIFNKAQSVPSTEDTEMCQRVGYKIENGAVLFVGTPQETQRISRWE